MAVEDPVKVTRYGRHERTTRSYPASETVTAGDVVTLTEGEVAPADVATQETQLLIAIDDRERGLELGDTYAEGESVHVVAPSGGAFNVLLGEGNTVDPAAEERIVLDSDGKVRAFDADDPVDVLFVYDDDSAASAPADDFLAIPVVVN